MKTVITYGTFDLFHIGHVRVLERVKALGDKLIVGCSTDEFNLSKGKKSLFSYEERSEILKACKFVDEVFPEESWDQKISDVARYKANVFAIGDDWSGKFDFLSEVVDVVYMPRTQGISTTEIRNVVNALQEEKICEIRNTVSHLNTLIERL
jgi:glycerol-3-phosphate cytidylyltransferase